MPGNDPHPHVAAPVPATALNDASRAASVGAQISTPSNPTVSSALRPLRLGGHSRQSGLSCTYESQRAVSGSDSGGFSPVPLWTNRASVLRHPSAAASPCHWHALRSDEIVARADQFVFVVPPSVAWYKAAGTHPSASEQIDLVCSALLALCLLLANATRTCCDGPVPITTSRCVSSSSSEPNLQYSNPVPSKSSPPVFEIKVSASAALARLP